MTTTEYVQPELPTGDVRLPDPPADPNQPTPDQPTEPTPSKPKRRKDDDDEE